jgi:hypothetical protein
MQEAGHEWFERLLAHDLTGCRHRPHREAVITPVVGDHLVAIFAGEHLAGTLAGDFQGCFHSF